MKEHTKEKERGSLTFWLPGYLLCSSVLSFHHFMKPLRWETSGVLSTENGNDLLSSWISVHSEYYTFPQHGPSNLQVYLLLKSLSVIPRWAITITVQPSSEFQIILFFSFVSTGDGWLMQDSTPLSASVSIQLTSQCALQKALLRLPRTGKTGFCENE